MSSLHEGFMKHSDWRFRCVVKNETALSDIKRYAQI